MNFSKETIDNSTILDLVPNLATAFMPEEDQEIQKQLRDECNEFLRGRLRQLAASR